MATAPEPLPALGLDEPVPVAKEELNSWRRGFTPQAELWNGRLAMLGLSIGLTVLLVSRLLG
ncbi:MAG: high light inducible protein [Prochlorococcaceae cyanobacterium]